MTSYASPPDTPTPTPSPKPRRRWLRWALPVATLIAGVALGTAVAGGDPTESDEYRGLTQTVAAQEQELRTAGNLLAVETVRADAAEASAIKVEEEAAARSAELDTREAAVAGREGAATAVEEQVAANTVGEGTWTVGVDMEPGTYRTAAAVGSDCYWSITASGSNGADIIENDIPGGGFPTVTLSGGQDFTNNRCGDFAKQ